MNGVSDLCPIGPKQGNQPKTEKSTQFKMNEKTVAIFIYLTKMMTPF